MIHLFNLLFLFILTASATMPTSKPNKGLNSELSAYISTLEAGFINIPEERIEALDKITSFIQQKVDAGQPVQLTYICTHNSRRSHFGQIWAATAAAHYTVPNVKTFSGGTEATAFNERAVAACRRAGFDVQKTSKAVNPVYKVRYASDEAPLTAFSKKFSDASNPQSDFCAVMTCTQADKACPVVKGAAARVAVPYDDPKAFDGAAEETAKYDERCKQIATETFYVFSKVKK